MDQTDTITRAAQVVMQADALFITAGAGIGVDSGLPDFRGNEGFWKAYPPIAKLGVSFVDMANPHWFDSNPRLAWAFYGHRLNLYRQTLPHSGFKQLLEIGQQKRGGYFVFTSNVDGQFQKAGFAEDRIEECHGSIHHFQCSRPCSGSIWDARQIEVIVDEESFQAHDPLPRCQHCNMIARPNILMFGDWSWIDDRTAAQGNRLGTWLQQIRHDGLKLAIIEIGAGEMVATVRSTSERIAQTSGGTLIRINPRDYNVPPGHIGIAAGGAAGVGEIYQRMNLNYR